MTNRRVLSLLAVVWVPVLAQVGPMWVRQYQWGAGGGLNMATDICNDGVGNVYVCGAGEYLRSDTTDMLLVKYDQWGDTLWVRSIDGTAAFSEDDVAHAMAVDSVGNVFVVGLTSNLDTCMWDATWAKFTSGGTLLWERRTGWDDDDVLFDVAVGGNGHVYACGTRYVDSLLQWGYFVMRLNPANGDTIWTRSYVLDPTWDGTGREQRPGRDRHPDFFEDYDDWDNCATALAIDPTSTPAGCVATTGYGYHNNREYEWWTMRFLPDGTCDWNRQHRRDVTIEHGDDVAYDVVVNQDGRCYTVGFDYHEGTSTDEEENFAVVSYDRSGANKTSRSLNIFGVDGTDWAASVCLDNASPQNVYVTGCGEFSSPLGWQIWTHKFSSSLAYLWGVAGGRYGGNDDDFGYDIHYSNGWVYVTGALGVDLAVVCYTEANEDPKYEIWDYSYNGPSSFIDVGTAVCATDSGHVYVAGQSLVTGSASTLFTSRLYYPQPDMHLAAILAPVGQIAYGDTVTPQVRIVNEGTTQGFYKAFMTIAGGFSDSVVSLEPLAAGDSAHPEFRTWTAQPAGSLAVRCSVAAIGDTDPSDDTLRSTVFVLHRDVGATRIVAPVGVIDSNQAVTPACTVYNYGATSENYQVRMRIGEPPFYNQTHNVVAHQPGEYLHVEFPVVSAWPRGTHPVRCSTELAGDMDPANDKAEDEVVVRVFDVGCTSLAGPVGVVDSGDVVVPVCSVYNYGSLRARLYDVRIIIYGAGYTETRQVVDHDPQTYQAVVFSPWTAEQRGIYAVSCSTRMTDDMNPANDAQRDSVSVRVIDVGSPVFVEPSGPVDSGQVLVPTVKIRNFGTHVAGFPAWLRVHLPLPGLAGRGGPRSAGLAAPAFLGPGRAASDARASTASGAWLPCDQLHEDSAWVVVPPESSATFEFNPWVVSLSPGEYLMECFPYLPGDVDHSNDTGFVEFFVVEPTHDVGAVEILAPTDTVDTGTVVVPAALVQNFGWVAETFPVRFEIGGFYESETMVTLGGQTSDTVRFEQWEVSEPGTHVVRCTTMLDGDANSRNDLVVDTVVVLAVGLKDAGVRPGAPAVFALEAGKPSPFVGRTVLRFQVPAACHVRLELLNSSGVLVRRLADEFRAPGSYSLVWDGRDGFGRTLSPGVYYCRLTAAGFSGVRKLVKTE